MPLYQTASTGHRVSLYIRDAATGNGKTGLAFNTSGLKISISRLGQAPAQITLATQTLGGAYVAGGFVEKSATLAPGEYELDIPNTALAAGATEGSVIWTGAGTIDDSKEFVLVSYDPFTVDPNVASIKSKTDNLPTTPADGTVIATATTALASSVAAVKAKTDNLPADTASVLSTLATAVSAASAAAAAASTAATAAQTAATAAATAATATGTAVGNLHNLSTSDVTTAAGAAGITEARDAAAAAQTAASAAATAAAAAVSAINSLHNLSASDVGTAITTANVPAAVMTAAAAAGGIAANIRRVNDVVVAGDGRTVKWGPA